jgi:hypothetical protein
MLAFAFRGADGAAHRVIETAKLALGSGVHIAHAHDDDVGLVVEIEAVRDQLFELDIDGAVEGASAATCEIGAAAFAAFSTTAWAVGAGATITGRAVGTRAAGLVVTTFFRTRTAALRFGLGRWFRRLLFGGLRLRSFLRLGSLDVLDFHFYYGLHFV